MAQIDLLFMEFLEAYLEENEGLKYVTMDDWEGLLQAMEKRILKLNAARTGFICESVSLDGKGRMVLPRGFRTRQDWDADTPLEAVLDEKRGVLIRKAY